ncbi:MAG TPA: ABC-2 family transporter protein [Gaiellaceae bacterium]|nr:ABC-2 family transporter protein [Gaiellaceae bacterium]
MTEIAAAPVRRRESWLRSMADFYGTTMRTQVQTQFQYRVALYMYTLGMVAEPTIYLVVWTTIARTHGGSVGGLTPHALAAYYIVWTFVRVMNIVFTPYGWEFRIREGQLSGQLLRPLHPIHYDMASFAGQKIPWLILYLPIGVALSLVFHPALHPSALGVVVFLVAIWGAYVIRSLNQFWLGMITFFTTRVGALFQVWFLAELLFSGRLLPLQLMPHWTQTLSAWLPFKWTFYFPIEALVGNLSNEALLRGLGFQALWTLIGCGMVAAAWRIAVRHYSAVGN